MNSIKVLEHVGTLLASKDEDQDLMADDIYNLVVESTTAEAAVTKTVELTLVDGSILTASYSGQDLDNDELTLEGIELDGSPLSPESERAIEKVLDEFRVFETPV